MTYKDEIEALIITFFYKYYKDYVEPLEVEHDRLLEENKMLKNNNYRDMAIKLKKKEICIRECISKKRIGSEYSERYKNRIVQ